MTITLILLSGVFYPEFSMAELLPVLCYSISVSCFICVVLLVLLRWCCALLPSCVTSMYSLCSVWSLFFTQCWLHFVFFLHFCPQPNKSLLFFLIPAWMLFLCVTWQENSNSDFVFQSGFAIQCILFFLGSRLLCQHILIDIFKPVYHVIKEKYSTCALTKANDSDKLFHPTVHLRHAHLLQAGMIPVFCYLKIQRSLLLFQRS